MAMYYYIRPDGSVAAVGTTPIVGTGLLEVISPPAAMPEDTAQRWDAVNSRWYWLADDLKLVATNLYGTKINEDVMVGGITIPAASIPLGDLDFIGGLATGEDQAVEQTIVLATSPAQLVTDTNANLLIFINAVFNLRMKYASALQAVYTGIDNSTVTDLTTLNSSWDGAVDGYSAPTPLPTLAEMAVTLATMSDTVSGLTSGDITDFDSAVNALIQTKVNALLNGAPGALDTLKELADAINDDASYAATITAALGNKVDKVSGKGLTKNELTDALLAKLNGIATGATKSTFYLGTTQKTNVVEMCVAGTVSGANVVFYLTADGTSTGTHLCPNGNVYLDTLIARAVEGTTPHSFGTPVLSNSNKTLTLPVTKLASVLGILSVNQDATGSVVKARVCGD